MEQTHTEEELKRQKELDEGFMEKWERLSDEGKIRYRHLLDSVDKRIKDNYKAYMSEKFINVVGCGI